MLKLKVLQASHPRVAGIVQAHRQQIDAAGIGRQDGDRRDMYCLKVISRSGEVSSWRFARPPVGFCHCASLGPQAYLLPFPFYLLVQPHPDASRHQPRRPDGRRQGADEVLGVEEVLNPGKKFQVATDGPRGRDVGEGELGQLRDAVFRSSSNCEATNCTPTAALNHFGLE